MIARIMVDGVETQYLVAGAGSLLLLLPGHGESGPAAGGQAPGTDLAPFVAAFLSAVGAEAPLDLAGHSGTLKNLPRCTRRTLMTRTAS